MTDKEKSYMNKIRDVIIETISTMQIYLFGSHAYGQLHEDSDYDIYVVLPDDGPRPLEAMQDIPPKSRFDHRQGAPTLEKTLFEKRALLYDQSIGA